MLNDDTSKLNTDGLASMEWTGGIMVPTTTQKGVNKSVFNQTHGLLFKREKAKWVDDVLAPLKQKIEGG